MVVYRLYSTWIFSITFKPWLFTEGFFCKVFLPVFKIMLLRKNLSALKEKNVRFSNRKENQGNVGSTRNNKLKLQYKVNAKLPLRRTGGL